MKFLNICFIALGAPSMVAQANDLSSFLPEALRTVPRASLDANWWECRYSNAVNRTSLCAITQGPQGAEKPQFRLLFTQDTKGNMQFQKWLITPNHTDFLNMSDLKAPATFKIPLDSTIWTCFQSSLGIECRFQPAYNIELTYICSAHSPTCKAFVPPGFANFPKSFTASSNMSLLQPLELWGFYQVTPEGLQPLSEQGKAVGVLEQNLFTVKPANFELSSTPLAIQPFQKCVPAVCSWTTSGQIACRTDRIEHDWKDVKCQKKQEGQWFCELEVRPHSSGITIGCCD